MSEQRRPRVLVVEDDPHVRRLIEIVFSKEFDVLSARTGEEALGRVEEDGPDLVMLDLNLPDISGVEATQRLRANPATSAIPIVIVSGSSDRARQQELLRAGADDFVSKPFDHNVLRMRVHELIDRPPGGRLTSP